MKISVKQYFDETEKWNNCLVVECGKDVVHIRWKDDTPWITYEQFVENSNEPIRRGNLVNGPDLRPVDDKPA